MAMIILPDRHTPRARFLMPVSDREWRTPSLAQPKDEFGRENRTFFRVRALAHDGGEIWRGWFEDREDFDAFLWAIASGSLPYERALWDLPSPMWPGLEPGLLYAADTVTFLSTTGSNQTYNKPSDWSDISNSVQCLGGGGSGGCSWDSTSSNPASGGTGGAFAKITNFVFSGGSLTYRVGSGGTAVVRTTSGNTAGNVGGPTYWNASADPGVGSDNSKCSAANGNGGSGTGVAQTGGQASASWGQTKWNGGGSGTASGGASFSASGGGGAAGTTADGGTSSNAAQNSQTAGGAGGATGGGSGGTVPGGNGGNGTNFDATHGSGGGGGGSQGTGTRTAGSGGNYGAAGGAVASTSGTVTSGAGIQGLIVVTYTPWVGGGFNQISLGM